MTDPEIIEFLEKFPKSVDIFLNNNPIYQDMNKINEKFSLIDFQGNIKYKFIERVGLNFVKLYLYHAINLSIDDFLLEEDNLDKYLNFLDEYDYPLDDFVLVISNYDVLNFGNLNNLNPLTIEKIQLIENQIQESSLLLSIDDHLITFALRYNYVLILEKMIHQVNFNQKILTEWLIKSIKFGNLPIIKILVKHGANIHIKNDYPLFLAKKYGYLPIINYLQNI